jgi:molybdopterin-guanine dinucleotide biosynthesis protein B
MPNSTVIVVCSAHRKQGKTQLVMRLVKALTDDGFEVGTIKHIGEESSFEDKRVKDTYRHAEAGAKMVVAATKSEIISIQKVEELSLEKALEKFPKTFDFIIVEGFKKSPYPRFIIIDKADQIEGLDEPGPILGVTGYIAGDKEESAKLEEKYPIFDEKGVDGFLAIMKRERLKFLYSQLPLKDCGDCGFISCKEMAENLLTKKISIDKCPHLTAQSILTVDGEQIPMKDFVQNIIGKGIEGMIQTLKGVPNTPKRIVIQIIHDQS